ncbi:MAG: SpoIIE family protein phosphatase [Deltaproteobacteria bacterium]|nr:SpoIIE family protein phosphatase [Deltaproteobacteria bacterium]
MYKNRQENITSPGKNRPLVLVGDDDTVTRRLVQNKLEKAGFEVICAKNGKEVISRLSDNVSAAVIDLMMPDINGFECLRYIKKNYPDMAPVMLTASGNLSNAVEAMKQGALDYITKPFNPGQLTALIKNAVHSFEQSKRLRIAEEKLEKARQHEIAVSSRIQQTLLLGAPPADIDWLEIAHLTIPSQQIDGDFYDFIPMAPGILDMIVADVMGKGIMAAFMGAALKSAFLRALNEGRFSPDQCRMPRPESIVQRVHDSMILQMEELETFVTLCYARFDNTQNRFTFVDCGHVRTIFFQARTGSVSHLSGANMPLGFPDPSPLQEFSISYAAGDFFLFYSDGLTEAANPSGELYEETRLTSFVERHVDLSPSELVAAIKNDVIAFTGTDIFNDDFTCVIVKVLFAGKPGLYRTRRFTLESDLKTLKQMRGFIREFCNTLVSGPMDDVLSTQVEVAATEITTNIIKHAYAGDPGRPIEIIAEEFANRMVLSFIDDGISFDPSAVPPPVLDGTQESGMGFYIINQIADKVEYHRDGPHSRNCVSATFVIT